MKDIFDKIFSIELKRELYERATKRFETNGHISIILGDSGKVLRDVLVEIDSRVYSGLTDIIPPALQLRKK
jgi:protein-L-isoaspartate O-methyltransferase